jgi:hypothetical protein
MPNSLRSLAAAIITKRKPTDFIKRRSVLLYCTKRNTLATVTELSKFCYRVPFQEYRPALGGTGVSHLRNPCVRHDIINDCEKTSKNYERRPAAFYKNRSIFQELKGRTDGQADNIAITLPLLFRLEAESKEKCSAVHKHRKINTFHCAIIKRSCKTECHNNRNHQV